MKKKISPSKDELYDLYIKQNLSQMALCQHYDVCKEVLVRWLKESDITKSIELQRACRDKTCVDKYGTSVLSHVDSIKEKRKQTCLEKYGGNSSMSDPAVRKKIFDQITAPLIPYDELYQYYVVEQHSMSECAKHFKLSAPTINKQIKQYNMSKSKEQVCQDRTHTNMLKYGVGYVTQLPIIMEKMKQTNLLRYGVESVMSSEKIKLKVKENNLKKYGVPVAAQAHYGLKVYEIISNKDKFIEYIKNNFDDKPSFAQVATKLQIGPTIIGKIVHSFNLEDLFNPNSSQGELEIFNLLKNWNITVELHNRTTLDGKEIDVYCPELKLGIEFNGDFWHSEARLPKNYHLNKSLLAESKGIRIIHIYEYEWNDPIKKEKIIALLRIATGNVERKIYARQCTIKKITNKEAKVLNDKIHLQGHRNAQVTYGLYYKDELVQLMSFSKTKYNRNLKSDNEWEIIRGCPGSNNIVVGGVSKLFKHFVKDYQPEKVFSYCDFNKFNGASYEALGMTYIGMTGPNKTWIIEGKGVPRNPSRYKELKELASGVVWGAGSKKYEITFNYSIR